MRERAHRSRVGIDSASGGGRMVIRGGTLVVDKSSISSANSGSHAGGSIALANAGAVTVTVDGAISLTGSGEISTDSRTGGNAGDITVEASALVVDGSSTPGFFTGISSQADVGSTGKAGQVAVAVSGAALVSGGGEISSSTYGPGAGGNVPVQAGSLTLAGSGGLLPSRITAHSHGAGSAGTVAITGDNIMLTNGGEISTASAASDAGNITVHATNLSVVSEGTITTSASGNGGSITLTVGNIVYLVDADVTAAAGGNGGNIQVDPSFVIMKDSVMSADAAEGRGGNITIITDNFMNSDAVLSATGATNGTIAISSPNLDLSGDLAPLPLVLESEDKRLRESCARSIGHDFSSLIAVGRGGTESAPEELQPDFGVEKK